MKKVIRICLIVVALALLVFTMASAQTANSSRTDRIVFLNGLTKEGTVKALTNDKVKFVHCEETLDYEFNKKEIEKIEFGSGRIEMINDRRMIEPVIPVNPKNRVAVLPVIYAGDGNIDRSDYMHTYLQQMMIDHLSGSAAELKYMNAAEINALLLKSGVTSENIQQYTPKELAKLLQVEYLVSGSVLQTVKKQITQSNNNSNKKQVLEKNANNNNVKLTGRSSSHSTEISMPDIETEVTLAIYNETGDKIYGKSRQSILSDPDAYKNAIRYLLKRTPLHKR